MRRLERQYLETVRKMVEEGVLKIVHEESCIKPSEDLTCCNWTMIDVRN